MQFWFQTRVICHVFGMIAMSSEDICTKLEYFHNYRIILFFLTVFFPIFYPHTSRIFIFSYFHPFLWHTTSMSLTTLQVSFFLYEAFSVSATLLPCKLAELNSLFVCKL